MPLLLAGSRPPGKSASLERSVSQYAVRRYGRELLAHGIDVAIPYDVTRLPVKVR
jgi:hypothetical protein